MSVRFVLLNPQNKADISCPIQPGLACMGGGGLAIWMALRYGVKLSGPALSSDSSSSM